MFEEAVARFRDVEAIVDGDERVTFAGWWTRAGEVAALLADHGVGRGDVVASLLPTSVDYALTYVAAVRLGAVMTGLNPRLGPDEVASILSIADPKVVVCEAASVPLASGRSPAVMLRAELGDAVGRSAPPVPVVDERDPVAIVWTSGTTGLPKGAWYDHVALRGAAACAGDLTAPGDRRLVPLPFMHAGFMTKLWDLVGSGNTVVLSPSPWRAETMLEQITSERITVAIGVPTQWEKLLSLPGLEQADLSSLRVAVTSTAPAPPELVRALRERLGCEVLVRYATTETGIGTGTRVADPPAVLFETVGRAHAGAALRITDASTGATLPPGEVGRVELRTLAQMRGYWNDEERTREALTPDGWVRTGDVGLVRPDGNLELCGRSTDMYIRGGYNVYPLEVENVLGLHPKVAAVAVVGAPAPVLGEIGVAVVVPTDPETPPELEELRAFAKERIADYKAPDRILIVDDLPRNASFKVYRPALRALVAPPVTAPGHRAPR